MNDKYNRNIRFTKIVSLLIFIMVFTILFCLVLGGVHPFFNNTAEALTSTNINNAVKAGGGTELWNSSTSSFNQTVLKDIIDKIFKQEDPVSFIKDNGKEDYETYGKMLPVRRKR